MSILLKNTETGETKVVEGGITHFRAPWVVAGRITDATAEGTKHRKEKFELDAKLAVWAASLGLPVGQMLDVARWLLKKNCPYCQLGTQVLRRVEELGKEKAQEMVNRILEAKKRDDRFELARLQEEFKNL